MEHPDIIGIIPAAGLGSRLNTLKSPKELLPVLLRKNDATGEVEPVLAAEWALQALVRGGAARCLLILNDRKTEMFRYLGDGSSAGASIAYLNQVTAHGLAAAVDTAYEWVKGFRVNLALPDAVFSPDHAFEAVNHCLEAKSADLVLGVFPTDRPTELGPVVVDEQGRVSAVLEKPQVAPCANTWGLASWGPHFTEYLHRNLSSDVTQSIGHLFNSAIGDGLKVEAVVFEGGSYQDLGTSAGLHRHLFHEVGGSKPRLPA